MVEQIQDGKMKTPFLKAGDTVRIWMEDEHGHATFGTIEQEVVKP
jgi:fumarylacetoacetate (FAA) hydrolase